MSTIIQSTRKLIDAKTIQDVMEAGLPKKVADIPETGGFNAFAKGPAGDEKTDEFTQMFDSNGVLIPATNVPKGRPDKDTQQAFAQVRDIITANEVQALGNRLNGSMIYNRANAKSTGLPTNIHPDIELDGAFSSARARDYLASTQSSTLIVPDEVALEIVRDFPFSEILQTDLDDPAAVEQARKLYTQFAEVNYELDGKLNESHGVDAQTVKYMREMHRRLQACLEPAEDGTVTLMTNLTFHARNLPFPRDRVFFQSIAYDHDDMVEKSDFGF